MMHPKVEEIAPPLGHASHGFDAGRRVHASLDGVFNDLVRFFKSLFDISDFSFFRHDDIGILLLGRHGSS